MRRAVNHITIGIFTGLLFAGCTTNHVIKNGDELSLNKQATLKTTEEKTIQVYNILTQGDSLVAFDLESNNPYYFHLNEIDRVVVKRRGKGALQGSSIGCIAGAGFGYAISAGSGWEAIVIMFLGSVGTLTGSIPGAIIAAKDHYLFEYDSLFTRSLDSIAYPDSALIAGKLLNIPDTSQTPPRASLSQLARTQMPEKPPEPKNQIAGIFFNRAMENPVNWVAGFSYRRFFQWDSTLNPKLVNLGKYYFNYSHKYITGYDDDGGKNYHWDSSLNLISLGIEGYSKGNSQKGFSAFLEMGFAWGDMHKSFDVGHDTSRGEGGLAGVLGARSWSNLLFSEVQLSYDSLTGRYIPCLTAGYRF